MLLHEKKRQKLLEKAKSRPSGEVLGCAPVGTAGIGSQPRLEAFVTDGRSSAEAIDLHAERRYAYAISYGAGFCLHPILRGLRLSQGDRTSKRFALTAAGKAKPKGPAYCNV